MILDSTPLHCVVGLDILRTQMWGRKSMMMGIDYAKHHNGCMMANHPIYIGLDYACFSATP